MASHIRCLLLLLVCKLWSFETMAPCRVIDAIASEKQWRCQALAAPLVQFLLGVQMAEHNACPMLCTHSELLPTQRQHWRPSQLSGSQLQLAYRTGAPTDLRVVILTGALQRLDNYKRVLSWGQSWSLCQKILRSFGWTLQMLYMGQWPIRVPTIKKNFSNLLEDMCSVL